MFCHGAELYSTNNDQPSDFYKNPVQRIKTAFISFLESLVSGFHSFILEALKIEWLFIIYYILDLLRLFI